jgi:hypothetical protein
MNSPYNDFDKSGIRVEVFLIRVSAIPDAANPSETWVGCIELD